MPARPWTPPRLFATGTAALLAALALTVAAMVVRGPLNPECVGGCSLAARGLMALALPIGIWGGILVAMGIVRREERLDVPPP